MCHPKLKTFEEVEKKLVEMDWIAFCKLLQCVLHKRELPRTRPGASKSYIEENIQRVILLLKEAKEGITHKTVCRS